jgi:alpha-glucosidase
VREWWRDAVVYQVYPRSFADGDGDGTGDLAGLLQRLDHVAELGADALWLSPFYPSPQVDGGYDVADSCGVDPLFGTIADLDAVLARAHSLGMRVTVDVVPNHTSDQHPWFTAAVAAGPGSPERRRYLFADGRGDGGQLPPNGWRSVFGGSSWTRVTEPDGSPGQWYYHLFAPEQPDLNWRDPQVVGEFHAILRFWLDRGVDGFRVDVADALMKHPGWPDTPDGSPVIGKDEASGVHDVYRGWRAVLDEYPGDRVAVIETGAPDEVVAQFLRPDELHLAFGFRFLHAGWSAAALRDAVDATLRSAAAVGAPATWVTDNHDSPRSVTRYARAAGLTGAYVPGRGAGPSSGAADPARGSRRARAAALLQLALPGAVYLYNGQELGLPNVDDLPDEVLQDPVLARSGGAERGRDGCRIPLPWSGDRPPFGFSPDGVATWLPQPPSWAGLTVERQAADPDSVLNLYRRALRLRRAEPALGAGALSWLESDAHCLLLRLDPPAGTARPGPAAGPASGGRSVVVAVNTGERPVPLPRGRVLLASVTGAVDASGALGPDAAAWLRPDHAEGRE